MRTAGMSKEPMPSQSDTEEQYRRHEEREFDRKHQRLRARQCAWSLLLSWRTSL